MPGLARSPFLRAAQAGALTAIVISLLAVVATALGFAEQMRIPFVYAMRNATAFCVTVLAGAIIATCAGKYALARSWASATIVIASVGLVSLAARWFLSDSASGSLPRPFLDLYTGLPNALSFLVGGFAIRGLASETSSTFRVIFAALAGVVSATLAFCGFINGVFGLSLANPAFEAEIATDATSSLTILGLAIVLLAWQRRSELGEHLEFLLPLSVAIIGSIFSFFVWRFLLDERNKAVESQTLDAAISAQSAIDSEIARRIQQLRYTAQQPDEAVFRDLGIPESRGGIRWLDSRRLDARDQYLRAAIPTEPRSLALQVAANANGENQAVFSAPMSGGGYRLAVLPLADLLDPLMKLVLGPDFNLLLVRGRDVLYRFPPTALRAQPSPGQTVASALALKGQIRVEPRFDFVRRGGTASLHMALATGLSASFLLGYSMFLLSTARKRLAAVVEARSVLQAEVEQRRRTEAELDNKARQLESSNAELQEFAHVVSHDLQEPLRTINGFAQLLSRRYASQLDTDGQEFLTFITDSSQRMSAMINGLLAYSRVTHAEEPDELVDLSDAVHWAKANLVMSIAESGATVETGPLPEVKGHRLQLSQMFQNLIGNAIKYRGPDNPVVTITAETVGRNCIITVADNGMGISPEFQDRIFGLFRRAHGNSRAGAGVGLALCKKVVERHGGRIWVDSVVGHGSRFHVQLPLP